MPRRRLLCSSILYGVIIFALILRPQVNIRPANAWWDTGHMIVSSRAIQLLQNPWRSFLGYYGFYLNETTVYPDSIYKHLDPQEEFRHFIDLEIWDPKKPETGTLAIAVEQFATEAVQAMKFSDWNKAFYLLGRVSHYLADIHQPYHSTVDYNPRTRTGKGLHAVLDASMEAHLKELKLVKADDRPLEPIQNLTLFCFQVAWQSHSFLQRMNQIFIDEEKEWSPELTRIVENRTNSAIVAVARAWYTITLRARTSPPQVPESNAVSVAVVGTPQEFDPDKGATLSVVVTDEVGICTPAVVRASLGDRSLDVHALTYVANPLGKYSISLSSDTLSQFRGTDVSLSLTAERLGYVSGRLETKVKIRGISPQVIQTILVMCSVVIGIAALGVVHLRRGRRKVTKRKQEP
mgnify:CR=1 FL=1